MRLWKFSKAETKDEKPPVPTKPENPLALQIYAMDLGEILNFKDEGWITRVPGGWVLVYRGATGIFIPYSDEFNPNLWLPPA